MVKILVFEDEWIVRQAVVDFLQRAGWDVAEAASGEDAVEQLRGDLSIDVVFTDLRLGGAIDGWDVGEVAREGRADRLVLYTSGEVLLPTRSVPGGFFIRKPYDPQEVVESCANVA